LIVFAILVVINFVVATSWLNFQGINIEEFDSETSPLSMEGVPPAVSLFLASVRCALGYAAASMHAFFSLL
jgi:hypothetical protein